MEGKFIIPFNKILAVRDSRYEKYEIEIICDNNTFGITKDNYKIFLSQYLAWLEAQSAKPLT